LPQSVIRSFRFALMAAALVVALVPALQVAAEDDQPIVALAPGAAMLGVDLPANNIVVSNGQTIDIGGWTTGSRVDVYLNGPAGRGQGIGSTMVNGARPDVVRATRSSELASSGYDVAWRPIDLSAGPHTLYIYSLVNGSWTLQTVNIVGEGNVLPAEDTARGQEPDNTPIGLESLPD
jgi:Bacterial Ig domain